MRNDARAKDPKNAALRLLKIMTSRYTTLIIVLVITAASSLASVYATSLLTPIINDCITPLVEKARLNGVSFITSADFEPLRLILIRLVLIYLFSALCSFFNSYLSNRMSDFVINELREKLFNKMQELPLSYFDSHTHGELMAFYTSDIQNIYMIIGNGITSVVSSAVTFIGTLYSMIRISFKMTVVAILTMLSVTFIVKRITMLSMKNYKLQQENISKLNGYMEEMMGGQKVVKVFNHEDKVIEDFDVINMKANETSVKANLYGGIMGPIMGNMSHISYAICAILGAYLCIQGSLDIGSMATFLNYSRRFSSPITSIMNQFNSFLNALAGAERIFTVYDMEPEVDEGTVTLVKAGYVDGELKESDTYTGIWAWKDMDKLVEVKGDVRFNNVTFSYDGRKIVLTDVSFYAKPGQKIAFVGATGAGKTTVTNLINRFYDIQQGEILFDGINVQKIKKASLRNALSMVLQDTHLFSGTIKENIRYGRLSATDDEIIAAAKLANADDFITALHDGYDTMLDADGTNLSQGQRQLLSIARAALTNRPVLILDEATSSIDTRTEKLIEEGMDNLMQGKTVFVIAHRLSTVRNSNAIMVLDQGKIIERGDHDDLLRQKGKYYQLYTGQFELD
ncbi:MAG: ABC transporter ATP-binding protein [Erysipelotrichaceae bacterium]|nr:ABC transporter ATP-binding protein [Erysipelotrichaceae bacterium]